MNVLMTLTLVLLFGATLASGAVVPDGTSGKEDQCRYKSCVQTKPGVLNVHIVPHSHDDLGWLLTVDQYYYGSRSSVYMGGVQYILDSVVKELWVDPKRRFIYEIRYIETAFFWKWWMRQDAIVKHKVHALVRQGWLQFVGGAWSMNDEATSHYQSIVDDFTWGLQKLNETFGPCALPRVGWQIDTFGHARETASLLAAMGYDGLFLGRIDYQDKRTRLANKTIEMVWRGDDDLGKPSDIFTEALFNTYYPPDGFCFDVRCRNVRHITKFNVDERVSTLLKYIAGQAKYYPTNNVMLTMGGDFYYQDSLMWYKNIDKLIQYGNLKAEKDDLNMQLFYSTPDCYLKAVKNAKPTLPTKQDDFFPYATEPNTFWTGYFTSRPTIKYFERQGNSFLQMVKHLQVLAGLEEHNQFVIDELKSAMGVIQHHDAITGTQQQHGTHDYEKMISTAIEGATIVVEQACNKVIQKGVNMPPIFNFDRCRFNESSCHASETSDIFVVKVKGKTRVNKKKNLQFSPLNDEEITIMSEEPRIVERSDEFYLENEHMKLRFDKATGELTHVILLDRTINVGIKLYYWISRVGNNANSAQRSSGTYIFRPKTTSPIKIPYENTVNIKGPVVHEVRTVFDAASFSVRLYTGLPFFELDFIVGPIPIEDNIGKGFIVRYETNIVNNGTFYTDSNGRQMLKRKLNKRPQWNLTLEEPITGNYYPVTNRIFIKDDENIVSVLTDRAQGGTSLVEGNIELMLHRRLLHDDAIGVGESLNEIANGKGLVMRGRHRVMIHNPYNYDESMNEKKHVLQFHLQPQVFVAKTTIDYKDWFTLKNCFKGMKEDLPLGVHMLTLEPWSNKKLLLRLENYLDKATNSTVEVDLTNIFSGINIMSYKEATLAANQWLKDYNQWSWTTENEFSERFNDAYDNFNNVNMAKDDSEVAVDNGLKIKLKAKQIRTLVVNYDIIP